MRMKIANNIKSTLPGIKNHNAKDFLKLVEEKFRSADKALAETLMAVHTTMKFDGSKSMQQHVRDMTNTAARPKTLCMNVDDTFKLIQEEARLKKQKVHSVNFKNFKKLKPKAKNFKKKQHGTNSKVANGEKKEHMDNKCKFCRRGTFPKIVLKKVKIVRSDRGGEYYEKYDKSGQCPGPFAKFLESHDICAKYTIPGTPQQNGVAERRNRTLMEMVRSMISKSSLPRILWIYALRTAMYLLNRIPSKAWGCRHYKQAAENLFSKNDKYSKGAIHMDIKFFIVKEEIQKQRVYLEHLTTDLMIADPLTKGLPPKAFTQYVPRLGVGCIDN
ncbi:retrovirus-related pol polyprotein from transposon TNT 1-94 [Tanacetum coccineum]